MNRFPLPYLLLLSLFLCALPVSARELQLVFTEREATAAAKGGSMESSKPKTLIVRLGENYFYVIRGQRTRIYDFNLKRMVQLRGSHKVDEYPLHALLAERRSQLRDAWRQTRILVEAGVNEGDINEEVINLETRYGLSLGVPGSMRPETVLDRTGRTIHTLNRNFLSEYKLVSKPLPKEYQRSFQHFILYECHLHSSVREDLFLYNKLPEHLKYRYQTPTRRVYVTLDLESAKEVNNSAYTQMIRAERPPEGGLRLEKAIRASRHLFARGDFQKPADYERMYKEAYDQAFYLDALLVSSEFYLQTGRAADAAMAQLRPHVEQDANLRSFVHGLDQGNPERAVLALEALNQIDREKVLRKPILDTVIADALLQLKRYREAEPLYLKALEANPMLAGTYKNLGELYYRSGRFPSAFKCWETAQHLSPDHPLMQEVDDLIRDLMERHPEYF